MTDLPSDLLDRIVQADALAYLASLPDESVHCIVTSPPYYALRDYGVAGQIGLEDTPQAYVQRLAVVFEEARRVLRSDGVLWLNIGDSFAGGGNYRGISSLDILSAKQRSNGGSQGISQNLGAKNADVPDKSLMGIPWRLAFALQDSGWILRMDCIWAKPNPMPESVTDRPTKAHEYVFLFAKSPQYWYDAKAVAEKSISTRGGWSSKTVAAQLNHGGVSRYERGPERNLRSVWTFSTEPTPFAHFATMPSKLVKRCILAGCPVEGVVLDMFSGSGTTALAARQLGRHFAGCDLSAEYVAIANKRLKDTDSFQETEVAEGIVQQSLFEGVTGID